MRVIDLTGQRFGRLTVLGRSGSSKRGLAMWLCKCVCGNTKRIAGHYLRRGTLSCGCLNVEVNRKRMTKHGMSGTSTHHTWVKMRRRCCDKKYSQYEWYGARGIKMCKRWQKFENFYADMGKRPKGMTIDRIDNSKGYSPSNCRWASWRTQSNNRKTNHLITFDGRVQTIAQWSREVGISQPVLLARLTRLGWSVERALTEPINEA